LPVEFIADAISTLGERVVDGFETYHVMNPYDDGIGLDEYVDWLIEAGYPVARVGAYDTWLQRFDTTLRALPERQRQASLLPLITTISGRRHRFSVNRSDGPVPVGGAGRENRSGQRHSACHAAGHRQIRHRPAAARIAVRATLAERAFTAKNRKEFRTGRTFGVVV